MFSLLINIDERCKDIYKYIGKYFRVAVGYIFCNVAVGIGMVVLVYSWHVDNIATWHQVPILFVLTLIYDAASLQSSNGQLWASLAYLLIVLSGFTSMVSLQQF